MSTIPHRPCVWSGAGSRLSCHFGKLFSCWKALVRVAFLVLFLLVVPPSCHSSEPVELTIWGMGMEGQLMGELTAEFERLHPEVRVRLQSIPWASGHEKLVTAIVGGMTPDVSMIGTTWMAECHAMNALEPLDRFIASSSLTEEAFFPGSLGTTKIGGIWYGLPWYVDTRLIFYRSDLVASAGFTAFPKTWDEFSTLCRRLKKMNPEGFPLSIGFTDSLQFMFFLWQRGGDILGENGTRIIHPPEAFEETLRWLKMLEAQRWIPSENEARWNFLDAFGTGSFSISIGGPWMIWELESKQPQLAGRWMTSRLPAALNGVSFLGGGNLAMFRASRNKEWAWKLMEFLTSPESQVKWHKVAKGLPSLRAAWNDPALSAASLQAFREQLEEARTPPCVPEWEQMSDEIGRTVHEAFRQNLSLSTATALLEYRLQKILDRDQRWQPLGYRLILLFLVFIVICLTITLYLRSDFSGLSRREAWRRWKLPFAFLFPALLLLTVFRFMPIVASFLASLTNWNLYGVADPQRVLFVGLENYRELSHDPRFWAALVNTLLFAVICVPLNIGASMGVALALNRCFTRLQTVIRTAFFLPVVSTLVAVAIVWTWIFNFESGPLTHLFTALGVTPLDWLGNPRWALLSVAVVAVWKSFGYNMVVFFVARQNIDEDLYETADLEGASNWQQFRLITLPMMTQATTFAAVVTCIGFLQVFTEPYMMTGGGPDDSTLSLVLYLYHHGFRFFRVGYATAIGFALFGCSLVLVGIRSHLRKGFGSR